MVRRYWPLGEKWVCVPALVAPVLSLSTVETEGELKSKYSLGCVAKHEI